MSTRRGAAFRFRLYVADSTRNSEAARVNLNALCRTYLADRYEIETVDVLREPERALDDEVFMTPTLVKLWPLPVLRIVGTLNETVSVLRAIGVESAA